MKVYRSSAYFALASGAVNAIASHPVDSWLLMLLVFGFANLLTELNQTLSSMKG